MDRTGLKVQAFRNIGFESTLDGKAPARRMLLETGAEKNCPGIQRPKLLKLAQIPVHLQFNRNIHGSYREQQNAYDCLRSLLYLHNETINVMTHALPIFYIFCNYADMWPWEETKHSTFFTGLGICHIISSISPWIGSVIYHTFMNHYSGKKTYDTLLKTDMLGVWVTQCLGCTTNLIASTWCLQTQVQLGILGVYSIISLWGLSQALTANSNFGRRLSFAGIFAFRVFGFCLRISSWGGGEPDILIYIILQDFVSILGGLITVVDLPEVWFPGKFDILFNSHQIMHVLVVLAVFYLNLTTNGDMKWILKMQAKNE